MAPFIDNNHEEDSIHTEASLESLLAEERGNRIDLMPPMPLWIGETHTVDDELNAIRRVLRQFDRMGSVSTLADWTSRVNDAGVQETGVDHDDRSIDSDEVPDLEPLDSDRYAQMGYMQLISARISGRGSGGETTTSLLPYYIEPMVIGQRDATIVVEIRGMTPRPLNELIGEMFRHPTITSFRIREIHDTHVEVRTRLGLFLDPETNDP